MWLPRITTFADRSVVRGVAGVLHDAVWLVETRLVDTPVMCVIDGTALLTAPQQKQLEGLAEAVGPCRRTVLVRDGVPGWAARWYAQRRVDVSTSGQLDVAEARIAAGLAHGSAVWLVGGGLSPLMAGVIQALRALRPDLRLFLALAAEASKRHLVDEVIASDGGWIELGGDPMPAGTLALEVEAMPDVALVVHAAQDPRAIVRPVLVDVDRLRVDAVTARVDEPVFVVRAVVHVPGVAWPIVTVHIARRSTARLPGDET